LPFLFVELVYLLFPSLWTRRLFGNNCELVVKFNSSYCSSKKNSSAL